MTDYIQSEGYIFAKLCSDVSDALYTAMMKDDWRRPIALNKAHGGDMSLREIAKTLAELGAHMEVTINFIDAPDGMRWEGRKMPEVTYDALKKRVAEQDAEITRLRAELATARCNDMGDAWIAQKQAWQEAVEDALLQWCDAPSEGEAPKDALRRLILHETTAALDPAVSQSAADLVATARRDALEIPAKWHDAQADYYKSEEKKMETLKGVDPGAISIAWKFAQAAIQHTQRAAAIRAAAGEVKP